MTSRSLSLTKKQRKSQSRSKREIRKSLKRSKRQSPAILSLRTMLRRQRLESASPSQRDSRTSHTTKSLTRKTRGVKASLQGHQVNSRVEINPNSKRVMEHTSQSLEEIDISRVAE